MCVSLSGYWTLCVWRQLKEASGSLDAGPLGGLLARGRQTAQAFLVQSHFFRWHSTLQNDATFVYEPNSQFKSANLLWTKRSTWGMPVLIACLAPEVACVQRGCGWQCLWLGSLGGSRKWKIIGSGGKLSPGLTINPRQSYRIKDSSVGQKWPLVGSLALFSSMKVISVIIPVYGT